MRILVDADACPVKDIIIKSAKEKSIEVIMYFDTAHVYSNEYAKTVVVSKGFDAVDMKLLSDANRGDICITNDYGLASLLITKVDDVINFNGLIFTEDNITILLNKRYISSKLRKSKKRVKGPKKRTSENDQSFEKTLKRILKDKV
ncbi:YaiI/YqxD family protein [Mycoplasmatota bacterium WC44]